MEERQKSRGARLHPPGARLERMLTDPVYEGESMQAVIDMMRSGALPAGSKLLYVRLGGVPALSAYGDPFRNG